jgi:hypothetical protein
MLLSHFNFTNLPWVSTTILTFCGLFRLIFSAYNDE